MTEPSEDLLVTSEGVDEGSAASTVEGPDSGATPTAGAPVAADPESQPAPPVDMESAEARAARAERGTGQQLQAGEG